MASTFGRQLKVLSCVDEESRLGRALKAHPQVSEFLFFKCAGSEPTASEVDAICRKAADTAPDLFICAANQFFPGLDVLRAKADFSGTCLLNFFGGDPSESAWLKMFDSIVTFSPIAFELLRRDGMERRAFLALPAVDETDLVASVAPDQESVPLEFSMVDHLNDVRAARLRKWMLAGLPVRTALDGPAAPASIAFSFDGARPYRSASISTALAPARGSLLLSEEFPRFYEMFEPDTEAVFFGTDEEGIEKANWLSKNPRLVARIREAGHRAVKERHLFKHRVDAVLTRFL